MNTLATMEQEACENGRGLFDTLGEKLKPEHNEMIFSLQYCKLVRHSGRSAEE